MSENFELRLQEMERKIARLEDRNAIANAICEFANMWSQKNMKKIPDFFALNEPDVCVEMADAGVYVGEKNVRQLFEEIFWLDDYKGNMLRNTPTNLGIEVAGDGKTARAMWWTLGYQTNKSQGVFTPLWCFSLWATDFIKEGDEWKTWHLHCYQVVKCDIRKGWVEDSKNWTTHLTPNVNACNNAIIKKREEEGLTSTYRNPYNTSAIQEAFPACPRPYDTWREEDADWMFADAPEMKGFFQKVED